MTTGEQWISAAFMMHTQYGICVQYTHPWNCAILDYVRTTEDLNETEICCTRASTAWANQQTEFYSLIGWHIWGCCKQILQYWQQKGTCSSQPLQTCKPSPPCPWNISSSCPSWCFSQASLSTTSLWHYYTIWSWNHTRSWLDIDAHIQIVITVQDGVGPIQACPTNLRGNISTAHLYHYCRCVFLKISYWAKEIWINWNIRLQ